MNEEELSKLKEGDVFEWGALFNGLNENEKMAFQVLEIVDENGGKRMTVRVYYHDIFVRQAILHLGEDNVGDTSASSS